MDMFVDLLDSQLQTPEEYGLLTSQDEGSIPVESHLNKLITAASDAAKASNLLPTEIDYSVLVNDSSFSSRLFGLSSKCTDTFSAIDPLFRKIGFEDYDDILSTQALEALSEEIYLGLSVHHNDPQQAVSDFLKDENYPSKIKTTTEITTQRQGGNVARKNQSNDFESRLDHFPLEIHSESYKRVRKHRQHRWNHLIDNFSLRLLQRRRFPKFNPLDPSGSGLGIRTDYPGPVESDPGLERRFVPKVYPSYDYLEGYTYPKERMPALTHPYSAELNALDWSTNFERHSHRGFKTLGGGSLMDPHINFTGPSGSCKRCKLVQTLEELESMITLLKKCSIVAIDVEHHSTQSYRGFVCLVQITGADDDWVIDPFSIFDEMWRLNDVTTDPRILKVMHGAESDILWLQRDFGVYVVNLFDTLKAADVLCLSCGHSLSSLVRHFLGIHLDKSYQLADWRIRPIPRDMLTYATADTHYLLDLYSALKNTALEQDLKYNIPGMVGCFDNHIWRIMLASKKVCLRQYRDPVFNEIPRAFQALRKNRQCPSKVDSLSLNMMLNLISFRNYAARVLDESDSFLFPDYAAVIVAMAADSKNTAENFYRAMVRRLPLLDQEIPYLLKLRNTLGDTLRMISSSGLTLTEPVSLSSINNILNSGKSVSLGKHKFASPRRNQTRKRQSQYGNRKREGIIEISNSLQKPLTLESQNALLSTRFSTNHVKPPPRPIPRTTPVMSSKMQATNALLSSNNYLVPLGITEMSLNEIMRDLSAGGVRLYNRSRRGLRRGKVNITPKGTSEEPNPPKERVVRDRGYRRNAYRDKANMESATGSKIDSGIDKRAVTNAEPVTEDVEKSEEDAGTRTRRRRRRRPRNSGNRLDKEVVAQGNDV
ncbi:3'-5' exonuclease family protein [Babesia bovis T2Bo]|uniref:Exosome component 10, putative n=1 Tax=Babesia bovis TaxID=5865 RepID=A7AVN6_BABBO|nr:3'-5' exonuclease family protein [Babesia bovis T2Bo]EDO05862.1 3'-5' exonuclease family protein [Babesia bovis T2Bo]|eukprot:XP_001609430.1 exosome component 10 [Babesia bovis T2Bo]